MKYEDYTKASDSELMELLNSADHKAWSEIISRYADFVYALSKKFLKIEADAHDNVQDVFIRLKKYANKFDNSFQLKAWLGKITCREALRQIEKNKTRTLKENKTIEGQNMLSMSSPISNNLENVELTEMINKEINLLPEKLRLPLVMYYAGDMTQQEIANELKVSQFSISENIKKALSQIKDVFKKKDIATTIVFSNTLLLNAIMTEKAPAHLQTNLIHIAQEHSSNTSIAAVNNPTSYLKPIFIALLCISCVYLAKLYFENESPIADQTIITHVGNQAKSIRTWKEISTQTPIFLSMVNPFYGGPDKDSLQKIKYEKKNTWEIKDSTLISKTIDSPTKNKKNRRTKLDVKIYELANEVDPIKDQPKRLNMIVLKNPFPSDVVIKGNFELIGNQNKPLVGIIHSFKNKNNKKEITGFDTICSIEDIQPKPYSFLIKINDSGDAKQYETKLYLDNELILKKNKSVKDKSKLNNIGFFTNASIKFSNLKYSAE